MWCNTAVSRGMILGAAVVLLSWPLSGCFEDETPFEPEAKTDPSFSVMELGSDEEELLFRVWDGSSRYTGTDLRVQVTALDQATQSRLSGTNFDPLLYLDPNDSKGIPGGYFFPHGNACSTLSGFLSGNTSLLGAEVHPPGPGQSPTGKERHCIVPGRYTVKLIRGSETVLREFNMDWVQLEQTGGGPLVVTNNTAGGVESVEIREFDPAKDDAWTDYWVDFHLNPGSYADAPVLDIENAYSNPAKTSFANQASPSGTTLNWFRFSAKRSTSSWRTPSGQDPKGRALSRIFWTGLSASGFYDAHSVDNSGLIRIHRYDGEVQQSPATVTAKLEIMRPDEAPGSSTANRTISITGVAPTACFTVEDDRVARHTDQLFDADCSTSGSNIRYSWRSEGSGSFTTPSTDPVFEHSGYPTTGNKTLTLKVEDLSSGLSNTRDTVIQVSSASVSLSGPTYVTDKTLKTYTSNQVGKWFERFNPDVNDNWLLTLTGSSTYNRIWAAGEYDVALRNEKTVSGELRRRRLDVSVCYGCSPEFSTVASMQTVAGSGGPGWGLFGLGPWISTASGDIVRFYDLTGLHEPNSPFATLGWLEAGAGSATDATGTWSIDWKVDATLEDVLFVNFSMRPGAGSSYLFGIAADPDLGRTPVDDRSTYDSRRDLIIVQDGEMAVGFALVHAGRTALRGVREYGARHQAPRWSEDAWAVHRASGLGLRSGEDDVQLVFSGPEVQGATEWVLLIVRGSTLADLAATADEAYRKLGIN